MQAQTTPIPTLSLVESADDEASLYQVQKIVT
jgi:hypothetical protein